MIDITKLLANAKEGLMLWSPLFGPVKFLAVDSADSTIIVETERGTHEWFSACGKYKVMKSHMLYSNAECLLFPSEKVRTWKRWKAPVEPKFDVGDWIIFNNYFTIPLQIIGIRKKDDIYVCRSIEGIDGNYSISSVDSDYHLWTIKDAKDGDVLVSGSNNPFIYNGSIEFLSAGAYVGVSRDGTIKFDFFPSKSWTSAKDVKPATKEQCEILFVKIKTAGYEWVADKKELRKVIEPQFKVGDDIKTGSIIETIAEIDCSTCSYYCESGRIISFGNQNLWYLVPKFKAGDWVVFNDNHNSIYRISEIKNFCYTLTHIGGGKMSLSFSQRELLRPWTIQDAKDGDVLLDEGTNTIGIFEKICGTHWHSKIYCGTSDCSMVYETGGAHEIKDAKPATKEQCDLFFSKIKEAGYEWDENKKEVRKIKPHYDITNFEPFDKVLIRDSDGDRWEIEFFSGIQDYKCKFVCLCDNYRQCIPFNNDTKHLLGTSDMCPEEFINW